MSFPPASSATRAHRGAALLLLLPLLAACTGYYPTWHYAPREEIHALHVRSGASAGADAATATARAEPDARIGARLVGIRRPAEGQPRKLHARFELDACGATPLVFKTAATRATPTGAPPLAPAGNVGDVEVAAGTRRTVDVEFDLPDPPTLANTALLTIDVDFTVQLLGADHASRATFRRAEPVEGPYYYGYGDPFWYGSPYYGGPWGDPWCGGPWWWGHGGFIVVEHR